MRGPMYQRLLHTLAEVCQPPPTLRPDHSCWATTLQTFAFQFAEGRAQDFLFQ